MPNIASSLFPHISKRLSTTALAILIACQTGCVTVQDKIPETGHQAALGNLVVVAAIQEPEIDFDLLVKSKGEGAAAGAGGVFLSCMGGLANSGCGGEFCGFIAVFWLGVCGTAGVVGGVAGAVAAPAAADVNAAEDVFITALNAETIQLSLRHQVDVAAFAKGKLMPVELADQAQVARIKGDYRALARAGIDTVLEVALSKIGVSGSGIDADVQLYMLADVRAIRTHDYAEIFSTTYRHEGERASLSEWSANHGERLIRGLEAGYEALGTHIYDYIILLYPLPDRKPHISGALSVSFGLAPIEPKTRGQLSSNVMLGSWFEWTSVDTLQPMLRWQGFPRETDHAAEPEVMGRISHVRYDLLIAREHNLAPAEIVYRRTGLTDTAHRLETPLSPGANYFWTVRATFELDGRQRVTEWGSTHFAARENLTSPSRWSYRFRTHK
jgi:hypothetical protein